MKRICIFAVLLGLIGLLLVPFRAQAQDSIPFYEFSSAGLDYPPDASGGFSYALEGTLGQTFVTVDIPTNTGQDIALFGFWLTEPLFPGAVLIDPLPPPGGHGPPRKH